MKRRLLLSLASALAFLPTLAFAARPRRLHVVTAELPPLVME